MMQINYVNVGKDAYLLEVPESLGGSVPRNYELQSSKKVCVVHISSINCITTSSYNILFHLQIRDISGTGRPK
jgi:hypothetical protein